MQLQMQSLVALVTVTIKYFTLYIQVNESKQQEEGKKGK